MQMSLRTAVLATTKVPNLKANHNKLSRWIVTITAVLATTKVPNVKANHNVVATYHSFTALY